MTSPKSQWEEIALPNLYRQNEEGEFVLANNEVLDILHTHTQEQLRGFAEELKRTNKRSWLAYDPETGEEELLPEYPGITDMRDGCSIGTGIAIAVDTLLRKHTGEEK